MGWLNLALAIVGTGLGGLAAAHALLFKRRPQAALGWIAVSLLLPFVGALLYYLFGINRVAARARMLRSAQHRKASSVSPQRFPWSWGNRVEPLHCGEHAYPAMLEAIEAAAHYVYLSTYIFDTAQIGGEFIGALDRARTRGVDVRVLVDGIGELYTWPRASRELRRRGISAATFLPPRLIPPSLHVNLRNHRKILVVDGIVGFTGGMNIAPRHLAEDPGRQQRVVDLHFKLEGPVVAELEAAFVEDWHFATGTVLAPVACSLQRRQAAPEIGRAACRVIVDGPDEDSDPLTAVLMRSIAEAEHRVAIVTPYFLPSPELLGVLQAAAIRGIDVEVLLPDKNNLPYVHWASRHMLWQLLTFGVRIYYQPAPFVHTKLLLADDQHVVMGSWNIDPRSLRLNFEIAVEIRDVGLASELGAHFSEARERSQPITLADIDGRSLPERLRDGTAWLFSPYL